ncbi:hypothetical protein D3C86_2119850 [compost metagenome]
MTAQGVRIWRVLAPNFPAQLEAGQGARMGLGYKSEDAIGRCCHPQRLASPPHDAALAIDL